VSAGAVTSPVECQALGIESNICSIMELAMPLATRLAMLVRRGLAAFLRT